MTAKQSERDGRTSKAKPGAKRRHGAATAPRETGAGPKPPRAAAPPARRCSCCMYSRRSPLRWLRELAGGWGAFMTCINHPDAPGELRDVLPGDVCRNFRARRDPAVRTVPPEPPNDAIRYIGLTQGKYAIVDAADYEWLNQWKWCAMLRSSKVYAMRVERHKTILMHREIMKPPKGMLVDHIDGNGLNNRRSNMRNCTAQQNCQNRRPGTNFTSQFAGVYQRKSQPEKWYARVRCGEILAYLGPFDDEVEAAKARDQKARELHGEFAYLNFPEEFQAGDGRP